MIIGSRQRIRNLNDEIDIELNGNIINKIDSVKSLEVDIIHLMSHPRKTLRFFVSGNIYLLCFASKHHTTIALKKLGHHNSLTPITVGTLQNININIENRNN
jgi:hypothetical protein